MKDSLLKYSKIIVPIISICMLTFGYLSLYSSVPLNFQPYDYWSAKRLARTLANYANCSNLEGSTRSIDYISFSCETGTSISNAMYFTIFTFYKKEERNKYIDEFKKSKEWGDFKIGKFYIIIESIKEGHKNKEEDFSLFPGTIVSGQ